MLSNSLIELDRAHLVHPVSSYRSHEALGVRVLKSAKGATLTDAAGHQLLDGFAGLWCVNVGYGQDSIVEAAARQLRELPYATGYFGLGSDPAIRLAMPNECVVQRPTEPKSSTHSNIATAASCRRP